MTALELNQTFGPRMIELFGDAGNLNASQADVWFKRLGRFALMDALAALDDVYAEGRVFPRDMLGNLLGKLRASTRGAIDATDDSAERARLDEEYRQIEFDLSQFTATQLEDYKREILRNEPWLKCFANLPVKARWWQALIYARYIEGMAIITTRSNGKILHQQISRDEYWELLHNKQPVVWNDAFAAAVGGVR